MLTLYYKPTCIFSSKVIQAALQRGLDLKLVDASFDESVIQEMIDLGGQKKVPFLVDSKNNVALYDSENIIQHLVSNYSDAYYGITEESELN